MENPEKIWSDALTQVIFGSELLLLFIPIYGNLSNFVETL